MVGHRLQRSVLGVQGSLKKPGSNPVFGSLKNDEAYAIAAGPEVLEILDKHRADQLRQKAG